VTDQDGRGALRLGILSTANINRRLLTGARLTREVDVVAVASRDADRARAYADEQRIERAYGSYEALLADTDVDAVYIPLPNSLHVPWTLRALEAGKHVLCEKPLSPDPDAVERLFDAAERAGLLLMEAFMYRHHPQTKRLVELVAGDAIGELRLVVSCFSFPLTALGDIRMNAELEGGALLDVGCYCVHGSRQLAGEPELVTSQQVTATSGVDARLVATLRFPRDVLAHFDCGFDVPHRSCLEAVGSDGTLVVADPWHITRTGIELRRGDEVEHIDVPQADRFQLELENFARAVRGEEEPLLGRADAVGQARALALVLAAASAARG
jgi:predicted dehydrogenase